MCLHYWQQFDSFFVDLLYPEGEHVLLINKSIKLMELELNLKILATNEKSIFILNFCGLA